LKCSMCGQPWQDCDKHFLPEDVAHYKLRRVLSIILGSVIGVGVVVVCVVLPAVMLYG